MGLALTELHKLPGYKTAPRIWRGGVRVLDPKWLEQAKMVYEINLAAALAVSPEKAPARRDLQIPDKNVRLIVRRIASAHGVKIADLLLRGGVQAVMDARHHAIYEVHRLLPHYSMPQISRQFANRDHTTILNSIRVWPARAAKLGIHVEPIIKDKA